MELSVFFFNQLRTIVATSPLKKTPLQTQNGVGFTFDGSPSYEYPTACGPFQCLPRLSSGYALILWHSQSSFWYSLMGARPLLCHQLCSSMMLHFRMDCKLSATHGSQPLFCVISETSKTGPCVWWPLWMFTKLDFLVPKDASYLLWGIFTQTCYQASRGLQVETCRWGVCDEKEGAVLMAFLSVWNDWWRSLLLFNTETLLLCCSYVCSKANVERVHESGGK